MTPKFTTGADLIGSWFADVELGEAPIRFQLPEPFTNLDVRPGRLILFGGAPGGGKTAAILQLGVDLLRMNPFARGERGNGARTTCGTHRKPVIRSAVDDDCRTDADG